MVEETGQGSIGNAGELYRGVIHRPGEVVETRFENYGSDGRAAYGDGTRIEITSLRNECSVGFINSDARLGSSPRCCDGCGQSRDTHLVGDRNQCEPDLVSRRDCGLRSEDGTHRHRRSVTYVGCRRNVGRIALYTPARGTFTHVQLSSGRRIGLYPDLPASSVEAHWSGSGDVPAGSLRCEKLLSPVKLLAEVVSGTTAGAMSTTQPLSDEQSTVTPPELPAATAVAPRLVRISVQDTGKAPDVTAH